MYDSDNSGSWLWAVALAVLVSFAVGYYVRSNLKPGDICNVYEYNLDNASAYYSTHGPYVCRTDGEPGYCVKGKGLRNVLVFVDIDDRQYSGQADVEGNYCIPVEISEQDKKMKVTMVMSDYPK